ncbi:MAG: carbohydrate-binding domain-containing protein [Phycisphaerae bacterium]
MERVSTFLGGSVAILAVALVIWLAPRNAVAGTPYPGVHNVPGQVQAEDYDSDGAGVAYYDTTPGNSGGEYRSDDVDIAGGKVTDVAATEWLAYTVNCTDAGVYRCNLRYNTLSANAGGTIHIEVDGVDVTGPFFLRASTGGTTVWSPQFSMALGDRVVKLVVDTVDTGGLQFDWFWLAPEPAFLNDWVAYYRFDNSPYAANGVAMTAIVDDSPAHNHGTPMGGLAYVAPTSPGSWFDRPGHSGVDSYYGSSNKVAADFNPSGGPQYFYVPDSPSLDFGSTQSFTIHVFGILIDEADTTAAGRRWVVQKKAAADPDSKTDYGFLLCGGDYAAAPTWTNLLTAPTGKELTLIFGTGTSVQAAVSKLVWPDFASGGIPAWHQALASYDAARHRVIFQVDWRTDIIENVYPSNVPNDGELWVGVHRDGAMEEQPLNGGLDELMIRNTARPASKPMADRKWYWQIEGDVSPSDIITADSTQPFGYYHVRWSDQPYSVRSDAKSVPMIEDPFNAVWAVNKAERFARFFWEKAFIEGTARPYNFSIAPDDKTDAATFTMRFVVDSFTTTNPTTTMKFVRFSTKLLGATLADFKPHFEVANDPDQGGAVVLRNDDTLKYTPPVTGRFHTLRVTGKAITDPLDPNVGKVAVRVFFDGELKENYVRTGFDGSQKDPALCPNDNNRRNTIQVRFDNVRLSLAGAFSAADFDMDGDVDLGDFNHFQECFNGPNRPPKASSTYCDDADTDSDMDVDLGDFNTFQSCFNGPNRPPKATCPV